MQGKMSSGVYCILNLMSRKRYVGSSMNMAARVKKHFRNLERNRHINKHLQAAWNRYGKEWFVAFCMKRCPLAQCLRSEQYYINLHNSADPTHGYNRAPVAGTVRGLRWRMSRRVRENRAKGMEKFWSSPLSADARKRISQAAKGRNQGKTYEEIYGAERAALIRKKASRSLRGRKQTEECKRKIALSKLGKPLSEEHKKSISATKTGRKPSLEHRQAIRDGHARRRLRKLQQLHGGAF